MFSTAGGADYIPVTTITFFPGSMDGSTMSFTIPLIDDDSEEGGPEEFTVSITSVGPNADIGNPSSATVKIFDDESECVYTLYIIINIKV